VDFCRIKVHRKPYPEMLPTIVITYYPTLPVVGQGVSFRLWVQTETADELLYVDFGDGTEIRDYPCWKEITHAYSAAGIYIVTVTTTYDALPVTERVKVIVPGETSSSAIQANSSEPNTSNT
jgi:hypothetical protein